MARLRSIACETKFNTKDDIDGESSGAVGITLDSVIAHVGGTSAKFPVVSNTSFATAYFTGATLTDYYARAWIRLDNVSPVGAPTLLSFKAAAGAQIAVIFLSSGTFVLGDSGSGQVGSASAAITANTWNLVELHIRVPTSGTGTAEGRLNGTIFASSTTVSLGTAAPGQLAFGISSNPASTMNGWADDVALNDGSGSSQNSWPGDGHIVMLLPISDNQVGSWTAGAGGTTNLWDALNNVPPTGLSAETNTSQIKRLAQDTGSTEYRANLQTYTTKGLVPTDLISVVQPVWNHGEEVLTGTKTGAVALTSNPVSSGTTTFTFGDDVGALGTYPTNWKTAWGDDNSNVYNPSITVGSSPVLKVNKTDAGTAEGDVDFMALAVDYISGGVAVGSHHAVLPPNPKGPYARMVMSLRHLGGVPGTVGPQTYTSDLAGSLSFVGSINRFTQTSRAGGLSFVGAFSKTTITTRTGGLSFSGAFSKQTNKSLTGGLSFVGSIGRFVSKGLSGALSFVGARTKLTSRSLTGALSFNGAVTKTIPKAFAGGLSFIGSISRTTGKALTGNLSFGGTLSKFTSKGLTGALSFIGGLTKLTIKGTFTAALSFVGTFAKALLKLVSFTAALSFVGGITRSVGKPQTGSLSFSGSTNKSTARSLTGGLSFAGAVTKLTLRASFVAALTFVGGMTRTLLKLMSFTASLSFSGTTSKQTNKSLTGGLSFVGAISRSTLKGLSAALSFVGGLAKFTSTTRTAALSFVGSLTKRTSRSLTGGLSFSGALTKLTQKILAGGLSFVGLLASVKQTGGVLYTQALTATLSFSGNVGKLTKRSFTAALGLAGTGIGPSIAIVSGRIAKRLKGIIYEDID